MDVKKRLLPLILCLALLLSGCRVRTRGDGRELPAADAAVGLADGSQAGGDAPGDPAESADGALTSTAEGITVTLRMQQDSFLRMTVDTGEETLTWYLEAAGIPEAE